MENIDMNHKQILRTAALAPVTDIIASKVKTSDLPYDTLIDIIEEAIENALDDIAYNIMNAEEELNEEVTEDEEEE